MRVSLWSWAGVAVFLGAPPLFAAPRTFVVDPAASSVRVHVGKSGAFSFAGHHHEVVAPSLSGEVTADPADLAASAVALTFQAAALKVQPEGEPAGDAPKVEEVMRGPKVLDAVRFPAITFKSQRVSGREAGGGTYDLELAGEIALHGVTRALTLPVHVEVSGDTLTASGKAVLRHDQFGMQPVSAAGGSVKVKNEIALEYRIVARGR
jgi:polyisoprenoid-binding protein YceI